MKSIKVLALAFVLVPLAACIPEAPASAPTARQEQARAATDAANSIRFTANAEIDNIRRRLELTSNPNLLGYILLLNQSGQPIMYEGVMGKVTSSTKRLTESDRVVRNEGCAGSCVGSYSVRAASSDEGTNGSSDPYVYYWNTDGTYRQWSGQYLYSTQPIRTRIEPLVVNVQTALPAAPSR